MRQIQIVALRRFGEEGFDSVTVQEIAADAGVSPSTVYRYFGVKEELVVWDEHDAVIAAVLARHLGVASPLDALSAAFTEAYSLTPDELAHARERVALIDSTPTLLAWQVARLDKDRAELVAALAQAYRRSPDDLELDLAARIAFAALLAAFEHWSAANSRRSLAKWIEKSFQAAKAALVN